MRQIANDCKCLSNFKFDFPPTIPTLGGDTSSLITSTTVISNFYFGSHTEYFSTKSKYTFNSCTYISNVVGVTAAQVNSVSEVDPITVSWNY